jgi:hypothetical protein
MTQTHYVLRQPDSLAPSDGWETNRLFPRWEGLGPGFYQTYNLFTSGFTVFQAAVESAIM